ncbi:MAG: alpha/beta hydrolase [Gammaproteobacteria bacterium]|nr:alpha/beta hydrolase [Gammaproteobacteria bacterium]
MQISLSLVGAGTRPVARWLALLAGAVLLAGQPASGAPTSGFFRTSDGVRLHYLMEGQGPTVVFVPGWTMPAEIWAPQIAHFAGRYRVVALDPRSQGRSEIAKSGHEAARRARDIHELLDAIQAERAVLVGWSLGVLEALAYVDQFGSDRLNALVLVDNSIGEEPPPASDPTFLTRLRKDRPATVERFVRNMYKTPQAEAYYQRLTAAALATPLEASIALLSYRQSREFWRQTVRRVPVPILYAVTPRFQEQAQNFKKHKPDAWIEVFEGAGHALFVDQAARFNVLLDDFIASQAPPAAVSAEQ